MSARNLESLLQVFKTIEGKNSFLFSFEGIEGCGKSTQIKLLTEYLESQNKKVYCFREPGGTEFGEQLRKAILESRTPIIPLAEAHLFASARAQLMAQEVLPKLAIPESVVILDRYIDSSIAYQACARKLGLETILNIHQNYPLNLMPHCTFYLHIDLETSFSRQDSRGHSKDYFEKETKLFYENLITGYDLATTTFHKRIIQIDGRQNIEQVHAQIKLKINHLLDLK